MTPRLIAPPALEPVSLAAIKSHLGLTHEEDDLRLIALLVVARSVVERFTRRQLLTQTWRIAVDRIDASRALRLPLQPVQTVSAVRVADAAGQFSPHPGSNTLLDLTEEPARLIFTGAMPEPGLPVGGIEIDVVAGYGASPDAVPAPLVQAVRMLTAHWYETRGTAPDSTLPADVSALIEGWRVRRLAA